MRGTYPREGQGGLEIKVILSRLSAISIRVGSLRGPYSDGPRGLGTHEGAAKTKGCQEKNLQSSLDASFLRQDGVDINDAVHAVCTIERSFGLCLVSRLGKVDVKGFPLTPNQSPEGFCICSPPPKKKGANSFAMLLCAFFFDGSILGGRFLGGRRVFGGGFCSRVVPLASRSRSHWAVRFTSTRLPARRAGATSVGGSPSPILGPDVRLAFPLDLGRPWKYWLVLSVTQVGLAAN